MLVEGNLSLVYYFVHVAQKSLRNHLVIRVFMKWVSALFLRRSAGFLVNNFSNVTILLQFAVFIENRLTFVIFLVTIFVMISLTF